MGQKVHPHGLRVGIIKDGIPAGMPMTVSSATAYWKISR